jgi:hypothetical protein
MFIATRTKQAFKLGRSGTCQPLFWQAAPNVARKLFDPDRPEKSLHADRPGSSDDR